MKPRPNKLPRLITPLTLLFLLLILSSRGGTSPLEEQLKEPLEISFKIFRSIYPRIDAKLQELYEIYLPEKLRRGIDDKARSFSLETIGNVATIGVS